ncbi:MAG: hypothetical protein MI753_07505 [Hyphomicrobiales bacterium]|nr:hypothetical protein [Hyphomicrobiales bacterium]
MTSRVGKATGAVLAATLLASAPVSAQTGQERRILEMTRDAWVAFRDFDGHQLIYFTHLEAWTCGIVEVRYSVNSEALDQRWNLQPCNPENPAAITANRPFIALPPGTAQSISVQLTYADGETSEIVTFTP